MESNNEKLETMYLTTIPNSKRKFVNNNQYSSLSTSDIEGARSRFIEKPIKPREVYNNRNDDIQKSHSRIIIQKTVNKADTQLEVDDIEGTRTKVNKFSSIRKTNPLNPVYQLPQVYIPNPPSPKFIRNNMHVDDIEGTRTKQTFAMKIERTGKFIEKQPYISQKKKPQARTNNFLLDVTDINCKQNFNKSKRVTNPLQPTYVIPGEQPHTTQQIGAIEGTKSKSKAENFNTPNYSLMTNDIKGAQPKKKRQLTSAKIEEIPGAKVATLKRGISTKRQTNPLQPKYSYLGASQTLTRPKTAAQRFDAFIY